MLNFAAAWNSVCALGKQPAHHSSPGKLRTQPAETPLGCIWAKAQGVEAAKLSSGPQSLQICCMLWGNGVSGAPDSTICPSCPEVEGGRCSSVHLSPAARVCPKILITE